GVHAPRMERPMELYRPLEGPGQPPRRLRSGWAVLVGCLQERERLAADPRAQVPRETRTERAHRRAKARPGSVSAGPRPALRPFGRSRSDVATARPFDDGSVAGGVPSGVHATRC